MRGPCGRVRRPIPPTRKPAWLPLGAAALIVPTALAGITLAWPRPQIETELGQHATEALAAAGIPAGNVAFSGRDATISGVPVALRDKARATVEGATGVRAATFTDAGAGGSGNVVPFGLKETGDAIVLTGAVGSEAERTPLVAAATAQAGGRSIEDQLTVQAGANLPDGVTPQAVTAAAAALAGANGDVTARCRTQGLTITGEVPDQPAKDAIGQKVAAALPGLAVDNQLTLAVAAAPTRRPPRPPPLAPGGPGELDAGGQAAAAGPAHPAARRGADHASARTARSSPRRAAPPSPRCWSWSRVLPAPGCRSTATWPPAPATAGSPRSSCRTQRAATVRDALVAGGVPADRISARGLGEGTPPAQTAAARRVEITVV